MTHKDIILNAIAGHHTPRNAAAIMSGGLWSFTRQGLTLREALGNAPRAAEVICTTAEEIGSDMIYTATGFYQLLPRALGAEIKFRPNGVPDVVAPVFPDLSALDPGRLDRIAADDGMQFLWDTNRRVVSGIGARYLVATGMFGPLTVSGHLRSVEQVIRAKSKEPQTPQTALDLACEACWRYIKPFLDSGSVLASLADPTASGDMISRASFAEFVAPRLQRLVRNIHGAGGLVMLHICGDVNDRLDLMRDTGADVLSVDFKVELRRARATLAGQTAFAGNLDPVRVMLHADAKEVYRLACEAILNHRHDGNYILMPGCDIPPQTPLENVKALFRAAADIGSAPDFRTSSEAHAAIQTHQTQTS